MPKNNPDAPHPYAMVYGSRMGGPRMYLGAFVVNPDETNPEARERIGTIPLAEWFDEMSLVVHNR